MIPRTDFHCITTLVTCSSGRNSAMHLLILWFRVYFPDGLLFNINFYFYFDCKIRLCLINPGRHEKIHFCTRTFYLQGILNDINEQDTYFLDCKHKHMMKCGAPGPNSESCTVCLHVEFHGFKSRINSKGYHSLVPGLISIFGDDMGPH